MVVLFRCARVAGLKVLWEELNSIFDVRREHIRLHFLCTRIVAVCCLGTWNEIFSRADLKKIC